MPTAEELFPREYEEWDDDTRRKARLIRHFKVDTMDEVEAAAACPSFGSPWSESALVVVRKRAERLRSSLPYSTVVVTYEVPDGASNDEEVEFRFNGVAQSTHIEKPKTNSDGTACITNYPSDATEHGGLIGRRGSEIEGCDVFAPRLEYSATNFLSTIDSATIQKLQSVVGCVNDSAWKYWAAKEVLFTGWTAQKRGSERWQLEYFFQIEKSVTFKRERYNWSLTYGSPKIVETIEKSGWDYYWEVDADYHDRSSGSGQEFTRSGIKSMHVARVYDTANFADIGIGA